MLIRAGSTPVARTINNGRDFSLPLFIEHDMQGSKGSGSELTVRGTVKSRGRPSAVEARDRPPPPAPSRKPCKSRLSGFFVPERSSICVFLLRIIRHDRLGRLRKDDFVFGLSFAIVLHFPSIDVCMTVPDGKGLSFKVYRAPSQPDHLAAPEPIECREDHSVNRLPEERVKKNAMNQRKSSWKSVNYILISPWICAMIIPSRIMGG